MNTKDNFAQAMKELLNSSEPSGTTRETEDKKVSPSSFSSFSQPDARPPRAPSPEKAPETVEIKEKIEEPTTMTEEKEVQSTTPSSTFGTGASSFTSPTPAPAPAPQAQPPQRDTYSAAPAVSSTSTEERTIIAKGTTIVGDITTSGSLCVNGSVRGNIRVASMLELNGKIIGDIEAEDAVIVGSAIKGNVTARNTIDMDGATTIVGDVAGRSAEINGKIKGNLTVDERGHFQSKAIIVGNLVAGTVIIDEGAMLKGDISITNAQTENISVEEPDFEIE